MTNLVVSWLPANWKLDVLRIHLEPPLYITVPYHYNISSILNYKESFPNQYFHMPVKGMDSMSVCPDYGFVQLPTKLDQSILHAVTWHVLHEQIVHPQAFLTVIAPKSMNNIWRNYTKFGTLCPMPN